MKATFKVFSVNLRKSIIKFLRDVIRTKHGPTADVCAVWSAKDEVYWETSHTMGILNKASPIEFMVRKQVGQNILSLGGIPKDEKIPVVYLVVFPSLVKLVGFRKYRKLIKEWPGKSEVMNGIVVVKYRSFIGRNKDD